MTITNEAIARRFLETVQNERNLEVIGELIAPDFIGHTAGIRGIDALRESITENLLAFPDLRVHMEEQFSSGDAVVSRYRARGTHLGDYHGLEPTNREVEYTVVAIHHLADGRITEGWRVVDRLEILEQLGRVGVNI